MPGDPTDGLGRKLADHERRLSALETAPRANLTTVASGQTRWLDADGDEAVAIGVDENGDAFIRVWNPDGTAPAFEVDSGAGVFPLAASAWQREATMAHSADIWSSITNTQSAGSYYTMWSATLALTSAELGIYFRYRTTSTAVGAVRLTCSPLNDRDGHTGQANTLCKSWTALSGDGATGFSGLGIGLGITEQVTVPNTIWSPAAEPAGSLCVFRLQAAVTSGSGAFEMVPIEPLYCSAP